MRSFAHVVFLAIYAQQPLNYVLEPVLQHGLHSVVNKGHCMVIYCDAGCVLLVDQ